MVDAVEFLKEYAAYAGCMVGGVAISGVVAYGMAACECAAKSLSEYLDSDCTSNGFCDIYRRNWRSLMDRPIGGMDP